LEEFSVASVHLFKFIIALMSSTTKNQIHEAFGVLMNVCFQLECNYSRDKTFQLAGLLTYSKYAAATFSCVTRG